MPENVTVTSIVALIRREAGRSLPPGLTLHADSALDELGLSSLQIANVLFALESRMGLEFDPADALRARTIGGLVEFANASAVAAG
ncbi:acyl carrier protein [Actinomadura atramentaria]|uniref:acyl carrier protein n=1 Tax=Actinomadura atramentaria TaxID=1990 RepID=UPI00037C5634|nr:acyl carrier protein [Actinomadura atramentaria]